MLWPGARRSEERNSGYPLHPPTLVSKLESIFDKVHFFPGLQGNDYSKTEVKLPTAEAFQEADAILAFRLPENLTSHTQTPNLSLIHCPGAGTTQLTDTPFVRSFPKDHPLAISSSSGIHGAPIGEHVLMSVIFLQHNMVQTYDITRNEKRWASPVELGYLPIQEIRGQTWGIMGYGHLGSEIARLASCFGASILACSRSGKRKPVEGLMFEGMFDKEAALPRGWYTTTEKFSLHEFLRQCDVVINTLPLSPETTRLISRSEFVAMKNSAIYVNVGRGPTTDTEALLDALRSDTASGEDDESIKIGGASLDVTDPEPLPDGHPLFCMPNVFLSPHCSWTSKVKWVFAVICWIQPFLT